MWIGRRMWMELVAKVDKTAKGVEDSAKHIQVLNHEYGKIKRDVGWLKWLSGAILLGVLGIAWAVIQKLVVGP